jgi:uncharacterized protein DUF4214/hemolysin type calcium-binding protein
MSQFFIFSAPAFVRPVSDNYVDPTGTFTTFNTHFSATAVTFEALGEAELKTRLTGSFQQDGDGRITGTITGIRTTLEEPSYVYEGVPIEQTVVHLDVNGVDFSHYSNAVAGNGQANDQPWTNELDAAFFAGDDEITVEALSDGTTPLVVNGHDGDDRIQIEPEFYDFFGNVLVSDQILPDTDIDLTYVERWKTFAPSANTVIEGGAGDDHIRSSIGDDTVFGGSGDDFIFSDIGQDRLYGGPGNDELRSTEKGIFGSDVSVGATAVYDYPSSNFIINVEQNVARIHTELQSIVPFDHYEGIGPSAPLDTVLLMRTISVQDKVADREGTDTLVNIDFLEFQDRTIDLNELSTFHFHTNEEVHHLTGDATALNIGALRDAVELGDAEARELVEIYTAFFDRAPDALGLYFWAQHVVKGLSLEEVAGHLAASVEAQALFPFDDGPAAFISAVYQNVLNRAPDADGLAFWSGVLEAGQISRGELVLEIIRGTRAEASADDSAETISQRVTDALFLEAKTYLGLYFSAYKGMSNVDHAENVFETFDGSGQSFAEAKTLIEDYHEAAMDPDTGELLITMVGITGGMFDT